jgi:hypothetical protein
LRNCSAKAPHRARISTSVVVAKREEFSVSLKVVFESFTAHSKGLCFQCDREGEIIQCGIADVALRDLVDFHRIKSTESEALRALLPEIERLVNAKYDAERFEENGWLVIWPVDLLRYGYQGRDEPAA